jgi:hypothetical protein
MQRAGKLLMGTLAALVAIAATARTDSLRLIVQNGYLPQIPVLVRVEIIKPDGSKNRDIWDAQATLTVDQPGVTLSTNTVTLRNGLGSALVTLTGGSDFNLTATVSSLQATRPLPSLASQPVTLVGGTLPGTTTTWSGIIQITNDVTVPSGHTLTIESNTIVLLNGVASGTTAADLLVNGAIQSLGTESHPVTITCANPGMRWGQIRHNNAQPSLYRYTTITLAGRAAGEGHTMTAPVIRPTNSKIIFQGCSITDHADASGQPGKIIYSLSGSDLTFNDCLLARARMGPEISGTALLCTNTWFMEMRGPDDSDGIYLHDQQAGQSLKLIDTVIAGGDDDAIDTLGSVVTVENCILRDWSNPNEDAKGISVFHGETDVRRCLIVNCFAGISAKSSGPLAKVKIEQSTILGVTNGVVAAFKSNATAGNILIEVTNSIVVAPEAIRTDFGATNFSIGYCNLSSNWPGTGNLTGDPKFVNALVNDYHLQSISPCIDAGDPAAALDADGTRADLGVFPFFQVTGEAPQIMAQPRSRIVMTGDNVTFSVTATGTPRPGYQWLSNTVALVDSTNSSVTISNVNAANNGDSFAVIVSNVAGTVTSDPAILNVTGLPQLSNPQAPPVGPFSFTLLSDAVRTYQIQATTNFIDWETLLEQVNTNGRIDWQDTNSANFNYRFYRVRSQP